MHYFDYAAACPIEEEALSVYIHASKKFFGNTGSLHDIGTDAKRLLEHCRERIAHMVGVEKAGIYFTSGGTESNEIALRSLQALRPNRSVIIAGGEHASIQYLVDQWEEEGVSVTRIPFTEDGVLNMAVLKATMNDETGLVIMQHVNGDIGTTQPVEEVNQLCDTYGALMHCDCVQSFGKKDLRAVSKVVDSLSLSAHKIGGPTGIGAVYIKPSLNVPPKTPSPAHESGMRPGTVPLPGVAAFTEAAGKSVDNLIENQRKISERKRWFLERMQECRESFRVVGNGNAVVGICLKGVEGQWAMLEANRLGYAFSTGSACQAGKTPYALTAMGMSKEEAKTFIRISFHPSHTRQEVEGLAAVLKKTIHAHNLV
ncbi:UNVERIFIED_CONTAM: IscS subfamily cysteine desulfurase [Halobacillus marinus]